jgi:hypothetical protein
MRPTLIITALIAASPALACARLRSPRVVRRANFIAFASINALA